MAAGRATVITNLAHLADVPAADPEGRRLGGSRPPVAIAIDLLDEEQSLQLALERLVQDAALRQQLGGAARRWWETHHRLETMAEAYVEVLAAACAQPVRPSVLPSHLLADGTARVRALAADLGVSAALADLLALD